MSPIATRVAHIVVCLSVLSTPVNPAKTAEPMKMPFGVWTQVGPMNHMLDGGDTGVIRQTQLNDACVK